MKKIIILLSLIISHKVFAIQKGCVSVQDDNSITFCVGEKALLLKTSGSMAGPYTIAQLTDSGEGYVKTPTDSLKKVIPSLDLAIMRGCNDDGVCIGDNVIWMKRHQNHKFAGLMAWGDIVIQIGEGGFHFEPLYFYVSKQDFKK